MRTLLALTIAAMLAACTTTSPDVVQRHDAQRMSTVTEATVVALRPVVVDGTQSGVGATAGAIAGGVAGASVGGYRESIVVGVIGAVVGGVLGNAVERTTTTEQAYEIILQLKNGERRAVVQAQALENFKPGDSVLLVTTGGRVRVTRAAPGGAPQ